MHIVIDVGQLCPECEYFKKCFADLDHVTERTSLYVFYWTHSKIFHLDKDLINSHEKIAKFHSKQPGYIKPDRRFSYA